MGAVTGAIGAGVGSVLGNTAWGAALAESSKIGFSAVSGAIGGGITGELFGEGFGKGAVYGAIGGAINFGVDKRYGEFASKSTFNKLIINGLKGGLNGLARGGDFIEGFAYGFAYGAAYEYADKLSRSDMPIYDEVDLENYFDPDAFEMFDDLMADPAYWLAGPGGAIPDELFNAWREFQAYVGEVNNAVRGTKVGGHIIDWMTSTGRALEAKFVRFIYLTKQLETFAKIYKQNFELWISDYTQKISVPLLKVIQQNQGKIMRVEKGVPKEVDIDKLIKAGGVLKNFRGFFFYPNPFYLPKLGNDFST
ncbi:MAG: hypothetical protein GX075_08645 [Firmicutes bacterium]|nr:hypothetical protein [Bacillota bacterium]